MWGRCDLSGHGVEQRRRQFGHRIGLHLAVLELLLVLASSSTAPIRRIMAPPLGKTPTTSARRLNFRAGGPEATGSIVRIGE
jgi:hypothetical protein